LKRAVAEQAEKRKADDEQAPAGWNSLITKIAVCLCL
jgi:hypothetical protein